MNESARRSIAGSADVSIYADGFQLLHAIYAVEYFLRGLIQRKCNFHVVFFDSHKYLCLPRGVHAMNRPKYVLARAVIKRHLSVNLQKSHPTLEVHSFASELDTAFSDYLKATGVYFVMCHDGANPAPHSTNMSLPGANEEKQAKADTQETSRKVAFRMMICWLINQSYNVALINGLEWADTKVACACSFHIFTNFLHTGHEHGGRRRA